MAKATGLTQIDNAAVRAIYLENGDWDAGLGGALRSGRHGHSDLDHPGRPRAGRPHRGRARRALVARVGQNHFVTITGAGHSPQRTHPEATILAILQALD